MEKRNPFVIYCRQCNYILADSFSLRAVKEKFIIFSISTISSEAVKSQQLQESKTEIDKECGKRDLVSEEDDCTKGMAVERHPELLELEDCHYEILRCTCTEPVGVKLILVNENWSGFPGFFVFFRSAIKSYQLGAEVRQEEMTFDQLVDEVERMKFIICKLFKRNRD